MIHCAHCDTSLCGPYGVHHDAQETNAWTDGNCPMCLTEMQERVNDMHYNLDLVRKHHIRPDKPTAVCIECPECGEWLPVEFTVEIGDVDATGDLQAEAVPDLSEVWSHAWSHNARGEA